MQNRFAGYFKRIIFAIPEDVNFVPKNFTLLTFKQAFLSSPPVEIEGVVAKPFDFSEDVIDTLHDNSSRLWASGLIKIVGDDALNFPEQWIQDNPSLAPYLMALVWLSRCSGWRDLNLDEIWSSLLNQTQLPYDVFCLSSGVCKYLPSKETLTEPHKMIWLLHDQTMWIFKLMPESILKQARIVASGTKIVTGRFTSFYAMVRVETLDSVYPKIISILSGGRAIPADFVCLEFADNGIATQYHFST